LSRVIYAAIHTQTML